MIHWRTASAEERVQAAVDGGERGPDDGLPRVARNDRRTGELLHRTAEHEQHHDDGDLAAAERYDRRVLDERPAVLLAALDAGEQLVDRVGRGDGGQAQHVAVVGRPAGHPVCRGTVVGQPHLDRRVEAERADLYLVDGDPGDAGPTRG